MAASAEQVAVAGALVDQYAAANDTVKTQAATAVRAAWASFESWYNVTAAAAMAKEVADLSGAAQDVTAGLSEQFVAALIASLRGGRTEIPRVVRPPLRNGASPVLVHMRAASAYKRAIATGSDHPEALRLAIQRSEGLIRTDLTLTDRDVQDQLMRQLGVTTFRRIIHPELSQSGTCGLCIVAADRVYKTGQLMPMHFPSCKCTVMPIIDDKDPGLELNRADLERLYAAAGSTKAEDLRRTRYRVDEHGEFGPNLSYADDNFRGPGQVALEDDPARAARMLEKTLPVLAKLEAAGGPADALAYQRSLVARLRRIAGDL